MTGRHRTHLTTGRDQAPPKSFVWQWTRVQRQQAVHFGASPWDLCALFMACHLQLERQAALWHRWRSSWFIGGIRKNIKLNSNIIPWGEPCFSILHNIRTLANSFPEIKTLANSQLKCLRSETIHILISGDLTLIQSSKYQILRNPLIQRNRKSVTQATQCQQF